MSKLSEAIRAHKTGRRYQECPPLDFVEMESKVIELSFPPMMYGYELKATFGMRAQCLSEDLPHAMDDARRAVIEEVFGEFRKDFYLAFKAIHEYDRKELLKILHDMQDRMFNV